MFRFRFKPPEFRPTPERVAAAAEALRDATADRLEHGDPAHPIAPTRDGRPFRGGPLLDVLRAATDGGKPAAVAEHPAAELLTLGTRAKGGTLESARPRRGKAMTAVIGGVRRFFTRAEYPPRKVLGLTRAGAAKVLRALLGVDPTD